MRDMIHMLREETLELLGLLGEDRYPHARLCLKFIDYDRLENCERDFFDYVLCLKNGTHVPGLYGKVVDCFQKALRVCPPSTIKKIIKITAGAIEGHGGEEPERIHQPLPPLPPLPTMWPPTTPSPCGERVINEWIGNTDRCTANAIGKEPGGRNIINIIGPLVTCSRKYRPSVCRFHKASKFIDSCDKLNKLIIKFIPSDDKSRKCVNEITSPKMKQCLAQLFLYVVSLHHAHYTPEDRDRLASKAKLCFKVHMPNCPRNFVDKLCRLYLVVPNVGMPRIPPPTFQTYITIPEGYIWCETRVISSEWPVQPTEVYRKTPPEVTFERKITPTTFVPIIITHPPRTRIYTPPPIRTKIITYPVPPRTITKIITPTTVKIRTVTPPSKVRTRTIPPGTPRIVTFQPPTRPTYIVKITPTTVYYRTVTVRPKTPRFTFPPPKTRIIIKTPPTIYHTKRITPTTIRYRTVTIPTITYRETEFVPTKVVVITPPTPTFTKTVRRTTRIITQPIRPTRYTRTRPPPVPKIFTRIPPPREHEIHVPPITITTRITRIPVTPTTIIERAKCTTTIKIRIIEEVPGDCYAPPISGECNQKITAWIFNKENNNCERVTVQTCEGAPGIFRTKEECERACGYRTVTTRIYTWTPPPRREETRIPPTTIEVIRKTPPVITPTIVVPRPPPRVITYLPPPGEIYQRKTPTTFRPRTITPRVHRRTIIIPMPPTRPEYFPPPEFTWRYTKPRTTVRTMYYTVPPIRIIENRKPTTNRVQIIEEVPGDCYKPPESDKCKNRVTGWYWNNQQKGCVQITYYGCEVIFSTKEECEGYCGHRVVPTRIFTRTPPPREHRRTKTPPTSRWKIQTIPPIVVTFEEKPPPPGIITWPPIPRIVVTRRTPTTSRIFSVPVTPIGYIEGRSPTTIKIKIKEKIVTTERAEYTPCTEEYVFPPETEEREWRRTPTTVVYVTEIVPTRTIQGRRTPPRPKNIRITRPVPSYYWRITPTTVSQFSVPVIWRRRKTYPPPVTRVFKFTPPEIVRTRIITPTKTEIFTRPPRPRPSITITWPPRPPKVHTRTIPPLTWTTRYTVVPRTVTYPGIPEEYICEYPTPPSTTICEWVPRKCKEGEEVVWRDKILKCLMFTLRKKGKSMYEVIVVQKNKNQLENIVKQCIDRIGDTICRKPTFPLVEWMLERVVTYVGEYGEHADKIDTKDDERFQRMKQCVILADESQLQSCLPGLYQALHDLIVFEKPTKIIRARNKQPGCLPQAFKHCIPPIKAMIEERLENAFGFCIRITGPSEKTGCRQTDSPRYVNIETPTCTEEQFDEKLMEAQKCVDKKAKEIPHDPTDTKERLKKLLEIITGCMKSGDCEIHRTEHALKMLAFLVTNIRKYYGNPEDSPVQRISSGRCNPICEQTGGVCLESGICECPNKHDFHDGFGCIKDKCLESLSSAEFRRCFDVLQGIMPVLSDVQDPDDLIKPVKRCLANALKGCTRSLQRKILKFFTKFVCPHCDDMSLPPIRQSYDVSRIGVTPQGVGVCGKVFRTDRPPDRPEVEDDCVRIDVGKGKSYYVLVPACKEERVKWCMDSSKDCVEAKVTNIGLRNPDYLTLGKVVLILKECINDLGPLKCRPKYRQDFKDLMTRFLQLISTNVLADTDKKVKNSLNFDKLGNKCKSILYKHLTFDTEVENLQRSWAKAMDCLRKSTDMDNDILEDLLDTLEMAMTLDEDKIRQLYEEGVFKRCSSGEAGDDNLIDFYNAPSFITCGPGGILRKKRNAQELKTSVFVQSTTATENITYPVPLKKVKRASSSECTDEDYTNYFEQLQKCGRKRLRLKLTRKRNKCKLNDIKHFWTALVDCMIENIGGELSCQVTNEENLNLFLKYVGRTLHASMQNSDDSCPYQPKCYGTEAPALFTCSNHYLKLLRAQRTIAPMRDILDRSLNVIECLNPIWPDCPDEIQFSALHFLYLPLGLNYDNDINRGLKFVSCEENLSLEDSSYSHSCFEKGHVNDVEENAFSSIETCLNCVKKKEGICIASSDTDLLNSLEKEISRISRCLKNFISEDDCLKDITTRIQDKCFVEFYRLYKNITKGIILNSIEHFRKFNKCLTDFKNDCPENYKKFTIHLYYDVLGLSSVFKPQFIYDEDSVHYL